MDVTPKRSPCQGLANPDQAAEAASQAAQAALGISIVLGFHAVRPIRFSITIRLFKIRLMFTIPPSQVAGKTLQEQATFAEFLLHLDVMLETVNLQ